MSLVVWLPLDGDLRNLGCSGVEVTNNGATIDKSGKIGKCYSFDGTNDYIVGTYTPTTNISFCCWAYFPVIPNGTYIFDGRNTAGNSGYQPMYIAASGIQIGGSGSGYSALSYKWAANTWYHICVTHDAQKGSLYVNGNFISSSTTAKGFNAPECNFTLGSRCNQSNYSNVKLNDVRIYDHCLSAAEVHEIAQGLVFHYKLDGNGFIDNIIPGTDNWLSWYKDSRWTASGNVLTYSAGSVSWVDADSPCIPWADVENKTLTVSVDLRSDDFNYSSGSGFSLCFVRKASGPTATSYSSRRRECTPIHKTAGTVSTNWTTYSRTYTNFTDANFSNTYNGGGGDWFGLYLWNYTNKSIQVRNIKVEISNKPTSWCPNAADALYSTLGLGEAIVPDSSGYGHNGKIIGTLTTSSDTAKYTTSTVFNGSSYVIIPKIFENNVLLSEFTWAGWVKRTYTDTNEHTVYNGITHIRFRSYNNNDFRPFITWYHSTGNNSPTNTWTTGPSLPENTWAHIAFTFKGGVLKYYYNGIYSSISDRSSTGQYIKTNYGTTIGYYGTGTSNYWIGNLSDVRIYTTQLLDSDIKLLYKMGMKVDNFGEVHTFEYIEDEEEEKNTPQGLLKTNEIEEYNGIAKIKKNKGWLSPNFIEM